MALFKKMVLMPKSRFAHKTKEEFKIIDMYSALKHFNKGEKQSSDDAVKGGNYLITMPFFNANENRSKQDFSRSLLEQGLLETYPAKSNPKLLVAILTAKGRKQLEKICADSFSVSVICKYF